MRWPEKICLRRSETERYSRSCPRRSVKRLLLLRSVLENQSKHPFRQRLLLLRSTKRNRSMSSPIPTSLFSSYSLSSR